MAMPMQLTVLLIAKGCYETSLTLDRTNLLEQSGVRFSLGVTFKGGCNVQISTEVESKRQCLG